MARVITIGLMAVWLCAGWAATGEAVYRKNCVACHRSLPVTLENLFFNYLLKYSSERRVKAALFRFIKHPTRKKALLSEELIDKYGLMPPSTLSDTDLRNAIDEYWETYKVFGKIK
jgi:cytochrome c551/c552